jgi:hypothetical protein
MDHPVDSFRHNLRVARGDVRAKGPYVLMLGKGVAMSIFGKKTDPAEWRVSPGGGSAGPYGIEETIRLMRGLPVEQNLELVVRVVKSTLESLNVRLSTIIQEATRKEQHIGQQIAGLRGEIAGFEALFGKRRQAIDLLEKDLAETSKVKERLELAEAASTPPPLPPDIAPGAGALPPAIASSAPPKLPPPPPFRPAARADTKPGAPDAKPGAQDAKLGSEDVRPVKSGGAGDDEKLSEWR